MLLTPEERASLAFCFLLQIDTDSPYSLDSSRAWGVTGQHDIKVCEITLTQTLVQVRYFLGSRTSPFELAITGMITYHCCESKIQTNPETLGP